MGQRVLVVDDEKLIVKGIRFSLEQDNMEVDCAYDGEEALEKLRANEYDMVLLDIMLPKLTGLEVCQQLREFSNVPVIMLTAKGDDMDKIMGLEYHLDCDSRRLYIGGKEINLTAKEFDLLELMALNPNKVYSRDHLLNAVWGYDYPGDVRTVDVHIRRLREKIENNPSEPKYVHTKWGVGYYFNA